jgi:exopolysaccharide/PEP-CTERM locus tyrosine autokinase
LDKIDKVFKKDQNERHTAAAADPLKKEDWYALLQYNRNTGKLDLHSKKIRQNPAIRQRLLANKMILSDGTLTTSAKKLCDKLRNKQKNLAADNHGEEAKRENETKKSEIRSEPAALSDSDLAFLMTYDRETGHLLRYDAKTGRLNNDSVGILNESGILQRLLNSKMIYPGGKLTPAGIKKCAESARKSEITADSELAASEPDHASRQIALVPTEYEDLSESDWATLVKYDRNTGNILRYDPETGQPDNHSRVILKDPDLIQRLIDKNLIVPGGWLTAKAKLECEKREQRMKRLSTDRSIEKVKQQSNVVHGDLVSLLKPQSFEAEQFKLIRTNLLYAPSKKPPGSILVTGPSPGEGKTFVAANLAISVASNIEKYVLLMDCDLRRPAIHERFGFGKVPGLSEYLSGGTSLHSLLLKTKVDRLTILPAGTPPGNPSELMSSERMSTLVEEVTNRYSDRLIIIDSPPSPLTAETGVIARHVDGILLVVKHRKTNLNVLRKMIERLGRENILGCVVNYLEASSLNYDGYRNYDKYGSYYLKKSGKD